MTDHKKIEELKLCPKLKFLEDKAYTINQGSDNYKMGYNQAIRDYRNYLESQSQSTPTLVELSEFEKEYSKAFREKYDNILPDILIDQSIDWHMKLIKKHIKIEPSKEFTEVSVEEIVQIVHRSMLHHLACMFNHNKAAEYKFKLAQAIHDLITKGNK